MDIEDIGDAYRLQITKPIADVLAMRRIFRCDTAGRHPVAETHPVLFRKTTQIEPYAAFCSRGHFATMGAFSYSHSQLPPGLIVGRYCSIAAGLVVFGEQHPLDRATSSVWSYRYANPVVGAALEDFGVSDFAFRDAPQKPDPIIGNDVWIGEHVMLARGIRIGDGAVIGAGGVVTRDVEPYAVMGGVPARMIRRRFPDVLCERFLAAHWWDYALFAMPHFDLTNPERFVGQVEDAIGRDAIRPYRPRPLCAERLIEEIHQQCVTMPLVTTRVESNTVPAPHETPAVPATE